jgi:hypothetical protein
LERWTGLGSGGLAGGGARIARAVAMGTGVRGGGAGGSGSCLRGASGARLRRMVLRVQSVLTSLVERGARGEPADGCCKEA